jgi:glycosyltransferase involved in cell wall biosynthesis
MDTRNTEHLPCQFSISAEDTVSFIRSLLNKTAKIAIFGAGNVGLSVQDEFRHNGINVDYFIDNDPQKQGTFINGTPVISVEHFKHIASTENIGIAVTAFYAEELLKQLQQEGLLHLVKLIEGYRPVNYSPEFFFYALHCLSNGEPLEYTVQDFDVYDLHKVKSRCSTVPQKFIEEYPADISVIIPVYNVDKYLRQCLDSVINQTAVKLQIICVDDGSTDNSLNILEEYARQDRRLTVITQKNSGLSAARNAAMPLVKGKYTLFVDSDDWIEPNLCETVFAEAERTNAEVVLFGFVNEIVQPEKKLASLCEPTCIPAVDYFLFFNHHCMVWNRLYLTEFLRHNGITFPDGLYYEDNEFNYKVLVSMSHCVSVPKILYHYRKNFSGIVLGSISARFDHIEIFRRIGLFLKERNLLPEYGLIYTAHKIKLLYRAYCSLPEEYQSAFMEKTLSSLNEDDWKIINSPLFPWDSKHFLLRQVRQNTCNFNKKTKN